MPASCGKHDHFDQDCLLCEAADLVNTIRTRDHDILLADGRVFAGNLVAVLPRASDPIFN